MMKKVMLFLLLIMLTYSQSCEADFVNDVISGTNGLLPLSILLSIAIITIAYILSKFFNNPQATLYVKSELFHIFLTFLVLAIVSSFYVVLCYMFDYTLHNFISAKNPFNSSQALISELPCDGSMSEIASCSYNEILSQNKAYLSLFVNKYVTYLRDSRIVRTFYYIFQGSASIGITVHKAANAIQYDILINLVLVPSLISLNIQKFIVDYASIFSMSYILPSAILLRMFSPTRDIGNAFMAIGFAGAFIVPAFYAFISVSYFTYNNFSKLSSSLQSAVHDDIFSDSAGFWQVGSLAVVSVFLPNLILAVLVMFITGFYSLLKAIG